MRTGAPFSGNVTTLFLTDAAKAAIELIEEDRGVFLRSHEIPGTGVIEDPEEQAMLDRYVRVLMQLDHAVSRAEGTSGGLGSPRRCVKDIRVVEAEIVLLLIFVISLLGWGVWKLTAVAWGALS